MTDYQNHGMIPVPDTDPTTYLTWEGPPAPGRFKCTAHRGTPCTPGTTVVPYYAEGLDLYYSGRASCAKHWVRATYL